MHFHQRISIYYSNLTKNDKIICHAILKDPNIVQNNIQEFAKNIGTSPAAILRCSKKLGYKGFADLKLSLEKEPVKNIETSIKKNPVLAQIKELVTQFEDRDYESDISFIINTINNSRRTIAIGIGNSSLPAQQLMYSLYTKQKSIECITTETAIEYLAESLEDRMFLIIFSVSGNPNIYKNIFNNAKFTNTKIILLTMNSELQLPSNVKKIIIPSFPTEICNDGLLNQFDNRLSLFIFSEMISIKYK